MLTALNVCALAAGSQLTADTTNGIAPEPTDLAKTLVSTLPVISGLPLSSAMLALAANNFCLDALAGNVSQPLLLACSSLDYGALSCIKDMNTRILCNFALSSLLGTAVGNVPDLLAFSKMALARSPWVLAACSTPARAQIPGSLDNASLNKATATANPVHPELSDETARPAPDLPADVGTSSANKNISQPTPPLDEQIAEENQNNASHDKATTTAKPVNPKLSDETAKMAPDLLVDVDKTDANKIIDQLTPSFDEQIEQGADFIVHDGTVQGISAISDAKGRHGLRYTILQRGYDGDILREDHLENLRLRLAKGETISWDHIVLTLLALLKKLTPESFKATIDRWMLNSSACASRAVTVDVYAQDYAKDELPPPKCTTEHAKFTLQHPGNDLVLDSSKTVSGESSMSSKTKVWTCFVSSAPVQFGDRAIAEEKSIQSLAEQEVTVTSTVTSQQKLLARAENGKSSEISSPEEHLRKTTTEWTTFKADSDLRDIAEKSPITPDAVKQSENIRLVRQDRFDAPDEQWADPQPVSDSAKPELAAAFNELLQGQNTLHEHMPAILEELDDSRPSDSGDSMLRHAESTNTEHSSAVVDHYTKPNTFIDDDVTVNREKETTHSESSDIEAVQLIGEHYVVESESGKETTTPLGEKEYSSLITVQGKNTTDEASKDETTMTKKGIGFLLGKSTETSATTHSVTGGGQTVVYKVSGKDISPYINDGRLSDAELAELHAERIHHEEEDATQSTETDKSTLGREFKDGWLNFVPIVGTITTMASKVNYDYDLTASDWLWAAADVGLCVATKGASTLSTAVGKTVVRNSARAGLARLGKEAPKLGTQVAHDIQSQLATPYAMAKAGCSVPNKVVRMLGDASTVPELLKNGHILEGVQALSQKFASKYISYSNSANKFWKDLYYKNTNFEFSLKNFPHTIFKDMTVDSPEWIALADKHHLRNVVKKIDGIVYTTDKYGRPLGVSVKTLTLNKNIRNPSVQSNIGKMGMRNDEGGHLLGNQFYGDGGPLNVVPQSAKLNHKEWYQMESTWKNALLNGKNIENLTIRPQYEGKSYRAFRYDVRYRLDGKIYRETFYNA